MKCVEEKSAGIDWDQRRNDWLAAINTLYGMIEQWLNDPVQKGFATIERAQKQITEAHLGTYDVDHLILKVGDESVYFSPKARNIVGGQGRVDIRGESGEAMLIVQPGSRWSLVASKYPQLRLLELDANTFGEMLRAIMRQ